MKNSLGIVARFPDEHTPQIYRGYAVLSFFGCALFPLMDIKTQ